MKHSQKSVQPTRFTESTNLICETWLGLERVNQYALNLANPHLDSGVTNTNLAQQYVVMMIQKLETKILAVFFSLRMLECLGILLVKQVEQLWEKVRQKTAAFTWPIYLTRRLTNFNDSWIYFILYKCIILLSPSLFSWL